MILAVAVPIELSIFLAAFTGMSGIIGLLARTLWGAVQTRIEDQDKRIEKQDALLKKDSDLRLHYVEIIDNMQVDVDRLSQGCGNIDCQWKERT